jgi:hypothetical protein
VRRSVGPLNIGALDTEKPNITLLFGPATEQITTDIAWAGPSFCISVHAGCCRYALESVLYRKGKGIYILVCVKKCILLSNITTASSFKTQNRNKHKKHHKSKI